MKSAFLLLILTLCSCQAQTIDSSNKNFETSYKVFGSGKPILIINGGPGLNSEGFQEIAKEIADMGFQTIIYDQRGTGKSKFEKIDSATITMDLMAVDIEQLRKQLNIEKWTVFGHSFGGILATYYYSKYPNSVDKLIYSSSGGINLRFLENISDRFSAKLTQSERDSLESFSNQNISDSIRRIKRAEILANAYVFNKKYAPAIARRLTQADLNINALVFQNLQKIKYDFTNQFKQKEIPVLVLQGKNDILSTDTAQEIADSFGNSNLMLFDNCGHYGWLDARQEYLFAVKDFLNAN